MDAPPESDRCAVCHDNYNIPYQANCSRWFCVASCKFRILQRYPGGHVDAPLCRREITLLVLSEAFLRQRHNSDVAEVLGKVERHNSSFAGHSCDLVLMILSTVYILSPLDFIPEGILGLVGLLDDPIILLIFFFHVAAIYHPLLCYLHGGS